MVSVKTKRASKDSLQRGRLWQGRQRERAHTVSKHREVVENQKTCVIPCSGKANAERMEGGKGGEAGEEGEGGMSGKGKRS